MNRHRTISLSVAALLSTALLAGCAIGGDPAPAAEPSRTPTAADTAGLRFAFTPGLADAHVGLPGHPQHGEEAVGGELDHDLAGAELAVHEVAEGVALGEPQRRERRGQDRRADGAA